MVKKNAKNAGRKRKYSTKKALSAKIDEYFASISVFVPVTDPFGFEINGADGKPVMRRAYFEPPMISKLCLFLGIDRSTWENYCDASQNPDFHGVTERTRMMLESYLEEILVTRQKGSVQGIIFNLQNNYGWREKKEVELGDKTRETALATSGMSLSEKMALIADALDGKIPLDGEEDDGETEFDADREGEASDLTDVSGDEVKKPCDHGENSLNESENSRGDGEK